MRTLLEGPPRLPNRYNLRVDDEVYTFVFSSLGVPQDTLREITLGGDGGEASAYIDTPSVILRDSLERYRLLSRP